MVAHAVTPQLYYSGAWNTVPLLEAEKVKIVRGVTADGEVLPATVEMTINNQTDAYRPTNPSSALYGLLQRNMPARVQVDGATRVTAEVASFSPDQTVESDVATGRGLRWVGVVGKGLLDRVQSWDEPVRSPLYGKLQSFANLRLHLPLEDARGTQVPLNAAPNALPAYGIGVAFADDDGPAGAGTATSVTATSRLGGPVRGMSTTAGYQVHVAFKLPAALPGGAALLPLVQWTMLNGDLYSWEIDSGGYRLRVTASDGTVLNSTAVSFGAGAAPWDGWVTIRFKLTQVGGNVSCEATWYPQDNAFLYTVTFPFAGVVSRPTTVRINGNVNIDGALFSHLAVLATVADSLVSVAFTRAFDGYRGELPGDRFFRLCGQLGITASAIGVASATWPPMGPQKPDAAIKLLTECATTDDGLLFDDVGALGVTFRTRMSLQNQAAALTLAFAGDIAPPLTERIDTVDIANEVTVSNKLGGTATAVRAVGALSNLAPPLGIGSKKASVDVNVAADSDLPVLTGWHLSRRTLDGSRYDTVVIDLDGRPSLTASVAAVKTGDRIVITGREPEPIDLIVYTIADETRAARRLVTFTCVPAAIYAIGVYNDTRSRYDVDGSTLAGAESTTDVTWAVTGLTSDDVWSTTSLPYEWLVAGERVRVTAMTAPAGTGPYTQTATVVRSVNGVVKGQLAAASVRLAPRTDSTPGAVRWGIGRRP